ncbi:S8 family serine peptidase [Hymenobacter canadensis]|uniref:S8 family serine peptidase n=1 Tax=Hymenobacter canadensis TaxID=2999067 RepID=A0ABY7LV68_9BACT|nr:S8 family serine peptidase [Hymenobacter canadensis]WBA44285.1 S8 family serine peptidase [Hymenobacter canadensis]
MAVIRPNWAVVQSAADEYKLFALEIDRIRRNTKLFRQGLIPLEDVSPDPARIQARLDRETAHEDWLPGGHAQAFARAQERMMGSQLDLQEACILEKLVNFSRAVGRIVLPAGQGLGTGWLIGEGLLLTNHHVLPNAELAKGSCIMLGYERSAEGKPQNGQTFWLRPDLFYLTPRETTTAGEEVELDFTVVAVESQSQEGKALSDYGYVTLDGASGKVIESENCMVIQHPQGDYKKVTLRDTRLLLVTNQPDADKHLFYESDTLEGSSGGLVIGLGTGEAIALHRASVPRLDAQGRVLRRDGRPWQEGDADDAIDWIANQGVRVSRLVDFITQAPVPPAMASLKKQLVAAMHQKEAVAQAMMTGNSGLNSNLPPLLATGARGGLATAPQSLPTPASTNWGGGVTTDFIVRVSPVPLLRDHLLAMLRQQLPGAGIEELIPAEVPSRLRAYLVITVPNVSDPWAVAAQLEGFDGVEEAEPDLPRYMAPSAVDVAAEAALLPGPKAWESGRGRAEWDEPRFLHSWLATSPWLAKLKPSNAADLKEIRRWNQRATGYDVQAVAAQLKPEGLRALAGLQLAQLDTGYTDHSKVREGYNLNADYDAIDEDDDARDPLQTGLGRNPGHGTRTGSILIGAAASGVVPAHDGNFGLLHELSNGGYTARTHLAPFRVARSVILLGSVKRVARAVQLALDHGFQVLTMSMGTLGNSMFEDLARTVYERGVIWACAAGNEVPFVVAPGKYPGVICVAASNPIDAPWSGSCRGPAVDITAPGEDVYVPILTDDNREDMGYGNGTSFATPHVAAAAMLWLAKNEAAIGTTYTQAWHRVEAFRLSVQRSARKAPGLPSGQFGAGILDIKALLDLTLPAPAELRHAYLGTMGIEKADVKRPLAVRELEYQDWQQVQGEALGRGATAAGALGSQPLELALAGPAPLSSPAQLFAKTLESYAGVRRAGSALEASIGPNRTSHMAYARLRALQQVQAQPKPQY